MQVEERNHGEAVLDVRFGQVFNALNESFWRHIDNVFGAVSIIGGGAAFAGVLAKWPELTAATALLVAVCGALERVLRPVEKAVMHAEFRRQFGELDAAAGAMTLAELDTKLRVLQSTGPNGIGWLSLPAYNDNVRSNGFEAAQRRETWRNKIARAFA